jgi:internalin A
MTNEELLEIIKQAATDKVTELNLSDKGLTILPPEIGQLTNLRSLDLNSNQLSSLPPEIGQLTNLRSLNLFNNQLSSLPA